MLNDTGIIFYKKRKALITSYGEYFGGLIHKILTSRREQDKRFGIELKPYYKYYIMGNHLLIG